MSPSQVDENSSEPPLEPLNPTTGEWMTKKHRCFQCIPIGIRLFPIVFFCNFFEIIQYQVVMRSHGVWNMCIDWREKDDWLLCSSMGPGILAATVIHLAWPVTGLALAILIYWLSTPGTRIHALRELVRVKVLTIATFASIFFIKLGPVEYILCLSLVVISFFSTFIVLLVCKMVIADVAKDSQTLIVQLAIILGAQKSSSGVAYAFVQWIMGNWGFRALSPIIVIAPLLLFCYSWSRCIESFEYSTQADASYGDVVEVPSIAALRTPDSHDIAEYRDENLQGDPVVSPTNKFATMIRNYFKSPIKLLRTSYFFGVYALGLIDSRGAPVHDPFDRSSFMSNLPLILETGGLLLVLPLLLHLVQRVSLRQPIAIGTDIQDSGALEDQLNVNRRASRNYKEEDGFSLAVWWTIACLIVAAVTIPLLSSPWTDLRMALVVIPLFAFSVGFYPGLQSSVILLVRLEERGVEMARLYTIGCVAVVMSAVTILKWDQPGYPLPLVGLCIRCLVIYSISALIAVMLSFLGWRQWERLPLQS
ncbi:hypothetical protein CPB86DRAFT_789337 [Serendipita vermifera]|nr:hypothetical protein CPB86DRAFT_789337 [Serendipita vermifera]